MSEDEDRKRKEQEARDAKLSGDPEKLGGLTEEEKRQRAKIQPQETVQEHLAKRDHPKTLDGLGTPSTPAVDTAQGPGTVKSGEGIGTVSVPDTNLQENPGSGTLVEPPPTSPRKFGEKDEKDKK